MKSLPVYKDPAQSIEKRIEDLLGQMTLEEKVGQLVQANGQIDAEKKLAEQHVGSFLQLPDDQYNHIQKLASETRLGIPLLLGVDAIHGNSMLKGATMFPSQLGMACTWSDELIKSMAVVTAKEMRYTGMNWTFSPVLCLTRDLRWGRVDETFGEDPYLIGRFAIAMIHGYQGENGISDNPDKVLATAKHYAGYSETLGGRDSSEAELSHRKLSSFFLPPFRQAVDAGCGSFMTGYQSIDGIPSTANAWLLRQVLKEEWGFKGLVVTDWNNVGHLVNNQKIVPDFKSAAAVAVKSGNDLMMSTPEFYQGCLDALNEGLLDIKYVEDAVRRILRVKFQLGLFENPRPKEEEKAQKITGCAEHRLKALKAATAAAVLLKNDGILPLKSEPKVIALIGPRADDARSQCGDWSLGSGQSYKDGRIHPRECTITLLDGLKKRFPNAKIVNEYCNDADLIIAAVGETLRYCGEMRSTATLELQDGQNGLLDDLAAQGKPFIVAMICTKPQILHENIREKASAIVLQFSPGMLGGEAFAKLIAGDENFSGRLTVSFPYHVGQQPIFYSQIRGQHGIKYADMTQKPMYPFGYGLTYSDIEYIDATLESDEEKVTATVTVCNNSDRAAVEVIQAYISDLVTSFTWVNKELKNFARVELEPQETKKVKITIEKKDLTIVDAECKRIVEPGDFELLIGKNSEDIKFTLPFKI